MKNFNHTRKFLLGALFLSMLCAFVVSQVNAQGTTLPLLTIRTTQYSVLGNNTFILGGSFADNTARTPFTTYFEYKRDNADLTTNPETTIPTVRTANIQASGVFYASPSLHVASTYYFRAVGCLNMDATHCLSATPSQKFYGGTLSFQTASPYPGTVPFTAQISGQGSDPVIVPYVSPSCTSPQILNIYDYTCVTPVTCTLPQIIDIRTNTCVTPMTCTLPQVINLQTNSCITPVLDGSWSTWGVWGACTGGIQTSSRTCTPPQNGGVPCSAIDGGNSVRTRSCSTSTTPTTNPGPNPNPPGSPSALVPCGTNDPATTSTNHSCQFDDIIKLINNVINFLLKFMVIPLAAIMFAYAGFMLITAGGEAAHARTHAKEIFMNALTGLVIAVAAFLVIKMLLVIVGYKDISLWF